LEREFDSGDVLKTAQVSLSPNEDHGSLCLVVAVADGYVGLTEWSLIRPDAPTGPLRR
jgi:hypothetical protein